jgi:transcriptional regulator GlxA family with amidase domain
MIESWDDQTGGWLQSTLRFIANEAASLKPGGETVITRLSDVVVIQAIRSWLETSPTTETGWLKALRDPQIGKALALMHRRPGEEWSVETLADAPGCRARPLRHALPNWWARRRSKYLTEWRMRLARAA